MPHRVSCLLNGAIFNDLERLLTHIVRSCHYLTLNVSEMVRDTNRDLHVGVILIDVE